MGLFNRIRPNPGFVNPVRSYPGFVSLIRSDPIQSDPGFVNGPLYWVEFVITDSPPAVYWLVVLNGSQIWHCTWVEFVITDSPPAV